MDGKLLVAVYIRVIKMLSYFLLIEKRFIGLNKLIRLLFGGQIGVVHLVVIALMRMVIL